MDSTVSDGHGLVYRLTNRRAGKDQALGLKEPASDSSTLAMVERADDATQLWKIVPNPNGSVHLINVAVGNTRYLELTESGGTSEVQSSDDNDNALALQQRREVDRQRWAITWLENGYCRLRNERTGYVSLGVSDEDRNGAVQLALNEEDASQHWRIEPVSKVPRDPAVPYCSGVPAPTDPDGPGYTPTSAYREIAVRGFTVRIHPRVDQRNGLSDLFLQELERQIVDIEEVVEDQHMQTLRRVGIWVELGAPFDGNGRFYHSEAGLKLYGLNPDKIGDVEFPRAMRFISLSRGKKPWLLMHELGHARVFMDSKLWAPTTAAYEHAVAAGLYRGVLRDDGARRDAYAISSELEYFPELTESYLLRNDYFPNIRSELEEYDPVGYRLMESAWGR